MMTLSWSTVFPVPGVEGADHAAHAGAGDDVYGDVVFFEPLERADLGESERAAAAEGEADAGAAVVVGRRGGRRCRGHIERLAESGVGFVFTDCRDLALLGLGRSSG